MHIVSLLSVIALGFFLGMRHATDPDHVIAVTTIVARHRSVKHAALIGGLWGVGHTLTILAVGGAIILLGWVIPARVGLSMEFSVGLMLILLGIMNLTGIMQWINSNLAAPAMLAPTAEIHSHSHSHGDYIHTHPHAHNPEAHTHDPERTPLSWLDRHFGGIGLYQLVRPLVVGLVHGLAGSAAVAPARFDDDPRSLVGHGVPRGIRRGDNRRDDADHGSDRCAVRLRRKSFAPHELGHSRRVRPHQPRLRPFPRLSNRLRQRPFHRPSAMDSTLTIFPPNPVASTHYAPVIRQNAGGPKNH